MSSHDQLADLLGAYALDAVDRDEAEVLERHVEICPRCAAELREHRETVARLGYMGGPAPLGLWDQIVATAHEAPPQRHLPPGVLSFDSAASRRSKRRGSLRVRMATVAVGIAAAVVVVLGLQVGHLDKQVSNIQAAIPATPSMAMVRQALATPGSRQVTLTSLASRSVQADAVMLPSGTGYVYGAKLRPLSTDRTYQLWGVVGDQRISYGLLGSDPISVVSFRAGPDVQALAVTDEVAGGVEHSSQPLTAVGTISAHSVVPLGTSKGTHA